VDPYAWAWDPEALVAVPLLVLALWQKVRDRLPYLLDPTEWPPPRIALSDGLVAVLAFFVAQGLVAVAAAGAGLPMGPTLLVAYVGAGALVTLSSLYVFWRLKVPRLLEAVGLRSPEGSVVRAIAVGPIAGLAAAVVGAAYLIAAEKIGPLRELMEEGLRSREASTSAGKGRWLRHGGDCLAGIVTAIPEPG
jgi:hypothetical protein